MPHRVTNLSEDKGGGTALPFEYAAFLSYSVGVEPGVNEFYGDFRDALARQTGFWLPKLRVYLDQQRLQGGDIIDGTLARAMCHSVCMVVLFNPQYFDTEYTYCAREYQAMLKLEERRLGLSPPGASEGLIVPVIIRGTLPKEISDRRKSFSLSKELLADGNLKSESVVKVLDSIAEVIHNRWQVQRPIEDKICGLCPGFELPSAADVSPMIESYTSPPKVLPWR
jgi:hypothetical protein